MGVYILRTPEGKIVRVNTETDEKLYEAPRNPPNTGTAYTRGTDLYRHVARSGKAYYYLLHWSMWQGEEPSLELISEEKAKNFLIDKAGASGWAKLTEEEMKRAEKLFPGIFEESA
jgi:hypothetical protein